jgi:hypothetical protein
MWLPRYKEEKQTSILSLQIPPTKLNTVKIRMATETRSGSSETLVILLVVLLMLSKGEMKATLFRWPQFMYCLPQCLVGETCFFGAYKKCMEVNRNSKRGMSGEFCVQVAQYYCDIGHMPPRLGKKIMSLAFRKTVVEQYDSADQY